MAKRSDGTFERIARDFYPTPLPPVLDLAPFLRNVTCFGEPFVGNGDLAFHLESLGFECGMATDIEPTYTAEIGFGATVLDVMKLTELDVPERVSHFISNPPWPEPRANGRPTVGMIHHLAALRPTWLLLSADFAHNVYAPEVLDFCLTIVSAGRVKWIEGSDHAAKDNAAWYLFDKQADAICTTFWPRRPRRRTYAADIEVILGD